MAKPIAIITLPKGTPTDYAVQVLKDVEKRLHDYHVLVLTGDVSCPLFNVFYEKDITELEVGELRKMILKSLGNV